jgi:hypothetical protein
MMSYHEYQCFALPNQRKQSSSAHVYSSERFDYLDDAERHLDARLRASRCIALPEANKRKGDFYFALTPAIDSCASCI